MAEKNKLTLEENVFKICDLLFMPSSFLRLAYKQSKEGMWKTKETDSTFQQEFLKFYPYISASSLEGFRLYGYYELLHRFFWIYIFLYTPPSLCFTPIIFLNRERWNNSSKFKGG